MIFPYISAVATAHAPAVWSLSRVQLCDSSDCSPPGSSVHGILQARILEWVAMPSSRGFSPPRDQTQTNLLTCSDYIVTRSRVLVIVSTPTPWITLDQLPLLSGPPLLCPSLDGLHWLKNPFIDLLLSARLLYRTRAGFPVLWERTHGWEVRSASRVEGGQRFLGKWHLKEAGRMTLGVRPVNNWRGFYVAVLSEMSVLSDRVL